MSISVWTSVFFFFNQNTQLIVYCLFVRQTYVYTYTNISANMHICVYITCRHVFIYNPKSNVERTARRCKLDSANARAQTLKYIYEQSLVTYHTYTACIYIYYNIYTSCINIKYRIYQLSIYVMYNMYTDNRLLYTIYICYIHILYIMYTRTITC